MINIKAMSKADVRQICNQLGVKHCGGCGLYRDVGMFYHRKASSDGLTGRCKDCARDNSKKWKEDNADYVKVSNQARRELRRKKQSK